MSPSDIIAAIATAPGRSGIGVVRVSGTRIAHVIEAIIGKSLPARRATLATFRGEGGQPIDRGVALYFPAPLSYTGEEVLELQGHGGPVVLRLLLERCLALGARIAEPGEFTRRAFLNDKLDLAQAEAVADLIDAATAQAARCAVRSLHGEFSAKIQELKSGMVELRALFEAVLDFPEEEGPFLERFAMRERLRELQAKLLAVIEASRQGSLLREGIHIVIAGQPNVGKSSLLNRMAGEDLAIVTEIPGTTRDAIRQVVDIDGIPTHMTDTAGLRESQDRVEQEGVSRAWSAIGRADLILLIVDATRGETPADHAILARLPEAAKRIRVMNKIDLMARPAAAEETDSGVTVWLSAKTGDGVGLLRAEILRSVGWQGAGEGLFLARVRHIDALRRVQHHLAIAAQGDTSQLELIAEELRLAQDALSGIVGQFSADDLLGEIFARFCIGK